MMNKKICSVCVAAVMTLTSIMCIPMSAMAQNTSIISGDYKYVVTDGKAEITDYIGSATDVVIPNTLDGIEVATISEFSAQPNNTVKSVTISDSVKKISNAAFTNVNALETLNTGNGVTDIYPEAFYDCHNLSNVTFGDNVKSIYSYVFVGCSKLKSVTLPKSVKMVGELAFPKTTAIKCYSTSTGALEYVADNGNKCTIIDKKTTLNKVTKGKKSFKVYWKKVSSMSGYQIAYSTSKTFSSKTTKTVTISGTKTTAKTINKLKNKKKYYVRIRAYKTVKTIENEKGKKIYGAWSTVKTVKTK